MKSLIKFIKEHYIVENNTKFDCQKTIDFITSRKTISNAKYEFPNGNFNIAQFWVDALKEGGLKMNCHLYSNYILETVWKHLEENEGFKCIYETPHKTSLDNIKNEKFYADIDFRPGDIAFSYDRIGYTCAMIYDGKNWIYSTMVLDVPTYQGEPKLVYILRKE